MALWVRCMGTLGRASSRQVASASVCQQRQCFAAEAQPEEQQAGDDAEITVSVNSYRGHRLDDLPPTEVTTSKAELMRMFEDMYIMRRMELAADMLYKQKLARGFLHLADGQEAVPVGLEAAASHKDSLIQSYRDHCTAVSRGVTVCPPSRAQAFCSAHSCLLAGSAQLVQLPESG